MGELIKAPFTPEQRRLLADWQEQARWHPFTCPNDGRSLVPLDRWVCASCDYEQSWAHAFMVEEGVHDQLRDQSRRLRHLREDPVRVEEDGSVGAASDAVERDLSDG